MTKDEIFRIVQEQIHDLTFAPVSEITRQASIFSLGMDSISVVRFIPRIEERCGFRPPVRDIYMAETVGAIVEAIYQGRQNPTDDDA